MNSWGRRVEVRAPCPCEGAVSIASWLSRDRSDRHKYRVIHKSFRDFRPLRYSSRDGHAEGEHVNRGRDTLSFCPTLQVLDMSTLGDAADVNPVIKFLPHTLHVCGRTETWSVSSSVDMLPFGVTIPATVPQRSEITEGHMNYPVLYSLPLKVFMFYL